MLESQTPKWLIFLERRLGWLAIPNIAVIFVTLQALGFLMVMADPVWVERLALVPGAVLSGQLWRLITFLALPLSTSLLTMIFVLWFLYFILTSIESEWGAFKTTFYVLVSWILIIVFSFVFDFPVAEVSEFQSTLFLAAAALFPEQEILLFLVVPVKMKWLGWLTMGYVGYEFVESGWLGKLYLVAIFSNYLIFFGPAHLSSIKNAIRRWKFKKQLRG